jgi:hypothetical protein
MIDRCRVVELDFSGGTSPFPNNNLLVYACLAMLYTSSTLDFMLL